MYCFRDLLPATPAYARKRWGTEPELAVSDGPFRAGGGSSGYTVDDPRIEEFEGTITERDDDDPDEFLFVTVTDAAGKEREFGVKWDDAASEYSIGRHMLVRFVEAGRLPNGEQIIEMVQIWLG
jgi:hypothetical protein